MTDHSGEISWPDPRTPVSNRFDDPYFSQSDGLAETRHVFLSGNDIPNRFRSGFHIAELGFGTGMNMLAAWQAYRDTGLPGRLKFTSFERYPLSISTMEKALSGFPDLTKTAVDFLAHWPPDDGRLRLDSLDFQLITGDARATLAPWHGRADAWFLDGFSPAKNPEMWEPRLMTDVARHTMPGGTFATYTAAGHVRRALAAAGFDVTRIGGFGRKRHMSVGNLGTVA